MWSNVLECSQTWSNVDNPDSVHMSAGKTSEPYHHGLVVELDELEGLLEVLADELALDC